MSIYIIILIAAIVIGIPLCKTKIGQFIYVITSSFALFIITAIRKSVGYDYNLYAGWYYNYNFRTIDDLSFEKVEKGFSIPFKLLTDYTLDYQVMFAVIGFIIMSLISIYILKYSSDKTVSIASFMMFGLFFNSMNFMRQMIAAVIVLYALKFLEKKQFLPCLITILFASCFHISSLIMIPFMLIFMIKMNMATLSIYSAIGIVLFVFSFYILDIATDYVYRFYDPSQNPEVIQGLSPVYTAGFTALFIIAFVMRKKLEERNPFNMILINSLYFGCFFEFMGIKHGIISRFALLFLLAPILILTAEIAEVIRIEIRKKFEDNPKGRFAASALTAAFLISIGFTFYLYLLQNNYNGVLPYQTIYS